MPVPDLWSTESTVEIDQDKYKLWLEARDAVKAWEAEAARLANEIAESLQGATAGTIDGRKVCSYRPKNQWAVKRLQAEYPDLTRHFMKPRISDILDVEAFAVAHPDIAEQYRVREFRELG